MNRKTFLQSKQVSIMVVGLVLAASVWAFTWSAGPRGKVVARLQQQDEGGYIHNVTVRQFSGRFRTELSDERRPGHDLPVSSYEFYEGSDPITSAAIRWPEPHRFAVTFSNGIVVDCSWGRGGAAWTIH